MLRVRTGDAGVIPSTVVHFHSQCAAAPRHRFCNGLQGIWSDSSVVAVRSTVNVKDSWTKLRMNIGFWVG